MTSEKQPREREAPENMDRRAIDTLLAVMARLRHPRHGCPWDVEQTFETIAPYTIEEAYEVADAISRGDMEELRKELGDLLLQVVFHARMAEEAGHFSFPDVVEAINDKMIFRHPHVFGSPKERGKAADDFWERAKEEERKAREPGGETTPASRLDGIALALPALTRAEKLQKRAARAGFDWPDASGVLAKIAEEAGELAQAAASGDKDAAEDELGDLLFSIVNLARHLGLDPEKALRRANHKFTTRFQSTERKARQSNQQLETLTPAQLNTLWHSAKTEEK